MNSIPHTLLVARPFRAVMRGTFAGQGVSLHTCEMKTKSIEERFWSKVDRNGPIPEHRPELGNCWVWTGNKNPAGYGRFSIGGKFVYPHRWIFKISSGKTLVGLNCLHKCDNPACVRPDHLFEGTQQDNYQDSVKKGRANYARGSRHGSVTCPGYARKGQEHGMAKLTEDTVVRIKLGIAEGRTGADLARSFGISQQQICNIKKGRVWKHITKN